MPIDSDSYVPKFTVFSVQRISSDNIYNQNNKENKISHRHVTLHVWNGSHTCNSSRKSANETRQKWPQEVEIITVI